MIEIIVHDIPPSNNKYLGNSRSHHIYRRDKETWHWLVKVAIKERPSEPYKKALVTLRYFFKTHGRRDPDNYCGKFILDALVKEGIIADDSFDVVTLDIGMGGVDKKDPRTVVCVVGR